jgi:hypothetical protein
VHVRGIIRLLIVCCHLTAPSLAQDASQVSERRQGHVSHFLSRPPHVCTHADFCQAYHARHRPWPRQTQMYAACVGSICRVRSHRSTCSDFFGHDFRQQLVVARQRLLVICNDICAFIIAKLNMAYGFGKESSNRRQIAHADPSRRKQTCIYTVMSLC